MIDFSAAVPDKIIVHKVGNKANDEHLSLSEETVKVEGDLLNELLLTFFSAPFKNEELYRFTHETELELNAVYKYVSEIFENENAFIEQSGNLAKQLFQTSDHPRIKSGELYVVFFKDCMLEDEIADGVGIFKTEHKDTFLTVEEKKRSFDLDFHKGVNINKLDKACIVLNTEKENGYIVKIADKTNKQNEAAYWGDAFLGVKPREDNYYFTQNYLNVCKNFADEILAESDKNEQIEMKNDAIKYFAESENFNKEEFAEKVLKSPDKAEVFNDYKEQYSKDYDVNLNDEFEVSEQAVKKDKRKFKSVIKLDKNFHVYVHGGAKLMERGYDGAQGKNFYKLFFDKEE